MNKKTTIIVGSIVAVVGAIGLTYLMIPKDPCQEPDALVVSNLKVEIDEPLKAYAAQYTETTGVPVCIKTVGGGADYGAALDADFASGNEPDIFVIAGAADAEKYADVLYDMSDSEWAANTDYAFEYDSNGDGTSETVGFPVSVESIGLIANDEILSKVGVNPDEIKTYDDLVAAVDAVNKGIEDGTLEGVEAAFSSTTKEGWVTGDHMTNALMEGSGEEAAKAYYENGDSSQLDTENFAEAVSLVFDNSMGDPATVDYDTEVAQFAQGQTAFLVQGNWAVPNLQDAGMDTSKISMVPFMYNDDTNGKMPVAPPHYYAVNANGNPEEAVKFLDSMATTEEGQNYMVNEANMIPAFNNITVTPNDGVSADVLRYMEEEATLPWLFTMQPSGFGMNELAPYYTQYAAGEITADEFINGILNSDPTATTNE